MPAPWVRTYIKLTEFLGQLLGPDYEVALHDVSNTDCSIIAIANGHISGRTVGAPLTAAALQAIASNDHETSDFRCNYTGLAANGRLLRSSTFYIKEGSTRLVGMLCVNFDDSRYRELSTNVLKLCHPDSFVSNNFALDEKILEAAPVHESGHEIFQNSLADVTDDILAQTLQQKGLSVENLSKRDRVGLIEDLDRKGFFLLKGAIKQLADLMGCSQTTVYRHIKRLPKPEDAPE